MGMLSWMPGNSTGWQIHGMDEMQSLAVAAIAALEQGELREEAQYLHSKVLGRTPEAVVDTFVVGENTFRWTFKPMVELLLHDLCDVALLPDLSRDARRERVRWALEAAGFEIAGVREPLFRGQPVVVVLHAIRA